MKKLLIILFLCLFQPAFAGTGGAQDTDLLYLIVLGFLSLILALLYTVSYGKKLLKMLKQRRLAHIADAADNVHAGEDFL